jgi:hypothetical protein
VLFVIVRPEAMFLVDLAGHGPEHWADDRLMQIVHDDWPELIVRFRSHLPAPLSGVAISPTERHAARKRLALLFTTSDGTVYFPPGGGSSSAGVGVRVVTAADRMLDRVQRAERFVRDHADEVRDQLAEQVGRRLEELRLRLLLHLSTEQQVVVHETELDAGFAVTV